MSDLLAHGGNAAPTRSTVSSRPAGTPALVAVSLSPVVALAAILVVAQFEVSPDSGFDLLPPEWFAWPRDRVLLLALVVGLGTCVMLAGWVELQRRRPRVPQSGVAAALLASAWAALPFALWGDQEPTRTVAFVVAAVLPVALAHLVLTTPAPLASPRIPVGSPAVWLGAYLVLGTLAVLDVLARDPFLDPRCIVHCSQRLPPLGSTDLVRLTDPALRIAWAALGLLTVGAAVGVQRAARTPFTRLCATAGIACGGVEVVWALAPSAAAVVGPVPLEMPDLLPMRLMLHAALTAAAGVLLIRHAGRQVHLQRMVGEIVAATPPTSVREIISGRIGDPGVRLMFSVPGEGSWIDEEGLPVESLPPEAEGAGDLQTAVFSREGHTIARIVFSDAEPRLRDLTDMLGPATVLALESERARAEVMMRLRALRAARKRVVEEADAARRRAERDLHDGAQHLLLAATFAIQEGLASARESRDASACVRLERALADIAGIAADLRAVAHGMYPVLLGDAGLVPALEGLALSSPVPTSIDAQVANRPHPSVALTVYQACALAIRNASNGGVSIGVCEHRDRLRLTIQGAELPAASLGELSDRTAALGGTMESGAGWLMVEVPCA